MPDTFLIPTPSGWLALDVDQFERALARGARLMPTPTPTTNTTAATPDEPLMSAEEAASLLRMPRSTLYRQAKAGKLSAVRVGRFYRFRRSTLLAAGATDAQPDGRR